MLHKKFRQPSVMTKLAMTTAALTLFAGCATPISDRGARIQVHSQMSTLISNCKNLGPITAEAAPDFWTGSDQPSKNLARDMTADKGGDTLVIVNRDEFSRDLMGAVFVIQGVALKCFSP